MNNDDSCLLFWCAKTTKYTGCGTSEPPPSALGQDMDLMSLQRRAAERRRAEGNTEGEERSDQHDV